MIKKLINILIFIFIFTLYIITFLMIYDNFKDKKLKSMEKSALNILEKEIKKEKETNEETITIEPTQINYGNYTILGKMEIPEIGLSTVILKEHTYAAMNIGAIKTYGSELNSEGGFIISGHNFKGRTAFLYPIRNLKEGSKIYITDVYGDVMEYTVYNVLRYVDPVDTSYYKDYNGYHAIITTCENGGETRIVVMARVEG